MLDVHVRKISPWRFAPSITGQVRESLLIFTSHASPMLYFWFPGLRVPTTQIHLNHAMILMVLLTLPALEVLQLAVLLCSHPSSLLTSKNPLPDGLLFSVGHKPISSDHRQPSGPHTCSPSIIFRAIDVPASS